MLTCKYLKLSGASILFIYLAANTVFAQSIIFSSDQWPKRWERVMQNNPMNGYVKNKYAGRTGYRNVDYRSNNKLQRWKSQADSNPYKRSRVPEYQYRPTNYNNLYQPSNQYYAAPALGMQGMYPMLPAPMLMGYGFYMSPGFSGLGYPGLGYPGTGLPGLSFPGSGYQW